MDRLEYSVTSSKKKQKTKPNVHGSTLEETRPDHAVSIVMANYNQITATLRHPEEEEQQQQQ